MELLALAIAPVAFLLIYIYEKDVIAKEPRKELVKAFIGGAIGTIFAVTIYHVIWDFFFIEAESWENPLLSALGEAFLEAAIPEEFFKFLVLYLLVWKSADFDENFDGIVYAVFVSMGFACTENIMYVIQGGEGVGYLRAFTAVPGHFFFAVIMGYYFSLAKFASPSDTHTNLVKSFVYAMIAHGIYDGILFLMSKFDVEEDASVGIIALFYLVFFVFNFFLWRLGFRRIKELRNVDLAILPDDHPKKPKFMKTSGKKLTGYQRQATSKPTSQRPVYQNQNQTPASQRPSNNFSEKITLSSGPVLQHQDKLRQGMNASGNMQSSSHVEASVIQQTPHLSQNVTTAIQPKDLADFQDDMEAKTQMIPTPNNIPFGDDSTLQLNTEFCPTMKDLEPVPPPENPLDASFDLGNLSVGSQNFDDLLKGNSASDSQKEFPVSSSTTQPKVFESMPTLNKLDSVPGIDKIQK